MQIINYFPIDIRKAVEQMDLYINDMQEIRIRMGQPIRFVCESNEIDLIDSSGEQIVANRQIVDALFGAVNDYSLYAHANSIKQGYITVRGGHRIGFVGQAVVENGEIKNVNNISSINIRISHQVVGVSDRIMSELYEKGQVINTLIISPPGFGKTTLLRDIVRNISDGCEGIAGQNVAVIDERSEIAATYKGMPENNVGSRCDVLDNAPKALGINLALRTMAPRVIAVDELGLKEDVEAIKQACNCGCSVIATVHGRNKDDLLRHPYLKELINYECFGRFVVIGEKGIIHVHN